jgi:3-methyladenine DNA glycosylase AlkD
MDIFQSYYEAANTDKALGMAAYMKNQFAFLGLQKPQRAALSRSFLAKKKKEAQVDWDFIFRSFDMPEREFQYLAVDYLINVKGRLGADDLGHIETLICTKPWWDTVDLLAGVAGDIVLRHEEAKDETIAKWMQSDHLWLRRVSILFQLKYKTKTDTAFLSRAILHNCNTKEFFLNKAIGWALREYSKTNAEWVRQFIRKHKLSALSVREASKYL